MLYVVLVSLTLLFYFIHDTKEPQTVENTNFNPVPSGLDERKMLEVLKAQEPHRQAANSNGSMLDLILGAVPQTRCATMVRLGYVTDGGKWICNPWRASTRSCVVYSMGVGDSLSFEKDMIKHTNCRLYTFDEDVYKADLFANVSDRISFYGWKIGQDQPRRNQFTIETIAKKLNHSSIDFLKIDIEGSENEIFPEFFIVGHKLFVCQVMIEFHSTSRLLLRRFLYEFEKNHFSMFAMELNPQCRNPYFCIEYSFIHRDCKSRFGLSGSDLFKNFITTQL